MPRPDHSGRRRGSVGFRSGVRGRPDKSATDIGPLEQILRQFHIVGEFRWIFDLNIAVNYVKLLQQNQLTATLNFMMEATRG
jgi:hypothetical protein